MYDSGLRRKGYTLEDIIHDGVYEHISELTLDDWKYIEYLYKEELNVADNVDTLQEKVDKLDSELDNLRDERNNQDDYIEYLHGVLDDNEIEYDKE